MQIREKIIKLRTGRALTQEELAEVAGVSRQSVAKWESGESLPELEKIIALSRFFAVTVDSLVKDEEPCAPAGGDRQDGAGSAAASQKELIAFLLEAKKNTYAAHGSEVRPSRPESHDLAWNTGDFYYYDTYLGGERFSGEEAVWHRGKPVWAMNYSGRTLDPLFSGDFLKAALMRVGEDAPYRGPRYYAEGDYAYHCSHSGSFEWYSGTELILAGNRIIYECAFHGGIVR